MAIDGKYIYKTAFKAIDYYGNIEKGATKYSEYFSPNNIRRLIISPDAVVVEFYVSVPGLGASKVVRLPSEMLMQVAYLPDYVPIVQIISTNRICTSIEEIIFITRSNDGRVTLSAKEYDFTSLISNFNRRSGNVIETIKQRYVRLRNIIIIQGTFNQFLTVQRNRDDMVGELDVIKKYAEVRVIHNETDWYTKWGTAGAAKAYPKMDGIGGHLYNYFAKTIGKRKEEERAKEIEDFKREKYGEAKKSFEETFDKLYGMLKMSLVLKRLIQECGLTEGVSIDVSHTTYEPLYSVDGLKDYPKVVQAPAGMDLNEVYRSNTETCQKMCQSMVVSSSKQFIKSLANLYERYKLTAQVMLWGRDIRMVVIPGLESTADMLSKKCHCSISGKNMFVSYRTFCHLTCLLFLNRSAPDFKMKYTTEDFWKGR